MFKQQQQKLWIFKVDDINGGAKWDWVTNPGIKKILEAQGLTWVFALDRQFHGSTQVKCRSTWLLLEAGKEGEKLLCLLLHCCDQTLSWDRSTSQHEAQTQPPQGGRLLCFDQGRKDLGHEMQKTLFPTGGSQQFSIDFKRTVPVSTTWG